MSIAQANDEQIKPACAHALHSLSMVEGKEMVFAKEGAILTLMIMALFRSDDALTKSMCASALFNLMQSNECRGELVKEGVVWALVKLSAGERYAAASQPCCTASMSWHRLLTPQHALCNAIDSSALLRQLCARMVCNLVCYPEYQDKVLENKGLRALSDLASSGGSPITRRWSAMALRHLSWQEAKREHLVTSGAVVPLRVRNAVGEPRATFRCMLMGLP